MEEVTKVQEKINTNAYTNLRENGNSNSLHLREPAFIDFQFFLPFHPLLVNRPVAIQEAIAVELEIGMSNVHIRECIQRDHQRIFVKGWIDTIEKHRKSLMENFHMILQKQKLSRKIAEITKIENSRLAISQLRLAYTTVDANNEPEIRIPEYDMLRRFPSAPQESHSKLEKKTTNGYKDEYDGLFERLQEEKARAEELHRRIDELNEEKSNTAQHNKHAMKNLEALNTKYITEKNEWEEMKLQMNEEQQTQNKLIKVLENKLSNFEKTKQVLAQNAQYEIDRLSYVINGLLQVDSCRQIVQLLVEESYKKKGGNTANPNNDEK